VHATLSDPEKRRLYDETGEVEEEGAEELSKSEREWYDYFRALFPKVRFVVCVCVLLGVMPWDACPCRGAMVVMVLLQPLIDRPDDTPCAPT
jgi:hypothetical protein